MGICEKIMNIGNTLEDNLNDRGVDCTFGIGTGEQNISDMVELITKQNIRGIGDANIQIIPNRPFVESGETIDVTVRLLDGVGNPLPNKIIRISNGTNSYNGITDNDGIYTLFNQTITTTTTYTVTYGTETASKTIQICKFVDYGVTGNHNDNWGNYADRLTVTMDSGGTTLLATTSNATGYYLAKNTSYEFSDYIVEFDVVSITNSVGWYVQADTTHIQIVANLTTYGATSGVHMKIVSKDGKVDIFVDGVKMTDTPITVTPNPPLTVGFRAYYNHSIKYKNFVIY